MKERLQVAALSAAALVFFLVLLDGAATQQNTDPVIPQHLLPCYRDPSIYARENRSPNHIRTFVDFVRRIERSRSGQQKSARDIAMALLYHLRLDGIQITPNVQQTPDITPFAPGGNEYYKHRLTLVGFLPKPPRQNYDFFNESLSQRHLCNLHYMLSYSIDPYKRENEDCSGIKFEDGSAVHYENGYSNWYHGGGYETYRRGGHPYRHKRRAATTRRRRSIRSQIRDLKRRLDVFEGSRRRRSAAPVDEHPDAEMIPSTVLASISRSRNGSEGVGPKEDFTLHGTDFIGFGPDHVLRGGFRSGGGGGSHKRTASYYGESGRVLIPGQQLSACPIENGVLFTPHGSVTIGSVIAGIAAGFNFQKISLADLHAEIKGPLGGEKINNIWATTLAGSAADLILSLGLVTNLRDGVGLRGGWNSLRTPRWYMLEKGQQDYLTDVELRGALDGLWLGQTVEKWNKVLGSFTLSSILEMYYIDRGFVFDEKVKASRRGSEVTAYAPTDEFKTQLHLTAVVMKNQRVNTVTYSDFTKAVSDVVDAVNNYVPQLTPRQSSMSSLPGSRFFIDQRADLVVVFDPAWGFPSLEAYIGRIILEELGATQGQSNLTLICPFGAKGIYPVIDFLDFQDNFRDIFEDCKGRNSGINYKNLNDLVYNFYSRSLMEENMSRRVNPHTQIALFMLSDSQRAPDSETIKEDVERIRRSLPGIELIVATNGNKDKFRDLVSQPEKDVFTLKIVTEDGSGPNDEDVELLLDRIAQAPRRLSNPASVRGLENATFFEGDVELIDDVRKGRTAVYRIDPFYIYESKDVKITLRTKGPTVMVCYAREQVLLPPYMQRNYRGYNSYSDPVFPDGTEEDKPNEQANCQTGSTITFDFENLCEDADEVEDCKPLYLSVHAKLDSKFDVKGVNCRYPTNVEYNVKASGFTGSGSAAAALTALLLPVSWALISFTRTLY